MSRKRYACMIYLVWTALAATVALGEFLSNRIYRRESAVFAGGWVELLLMRTFPCLAIRGNG